MDIGQFQFLYFFNFLYFWIFGPFFGFGLQWRFWASLGVLVSYKITRGVKLVVGGALVFLDGLGRSGGV